jgi:hypothetical protein
VTEDKNPAPEPGPKVSRPGDAPRPFEPDREIVFYYNRERRLERASADVRALNEGRLRIQGGVIRSLTSTKPHLLLFITIMIIFAGIMVFSRLPGSRAGGLILEGNTLRLSAGGGSEPFILVTKTIAPGVEAPYTGPVYIGISPFIKSPGKTDSADIPIFTDQIFFTLEDGEEYRFDLPFRAETYLVLFQAGDHRVSTRVNAGK